MVTVQNARYTKQGDERKAYPRVKKLSRFQNKDKSIHFHQICLRLPGIANIRLL